MAGTQLYNSKQDPIYPFTEGGNVSSAVIPSAVTVDDALSYLNTLISKLSGDEEAVTAITVNVGYGLSKTDDENELKQNPPSWENKYQMPDAEYPYAWKKTEIKVAEVSNVFYEIVASDMADSTQIIYTTLSNDTQPIIKYPKKIVNGEETNEEDLTAFDDTLPKYNDSYGNKADWSETPQSISAQQPYLYMSTRKRIKGEWEKFSTPALLGRWVFDSKVEFRYMTTPTATTLTGVMEHLDLGADNPGNSWSTSVPESFNSGKLWMITATSVNGVKNKDANGVIWSMPNLISII